MCDTSWPNNFSWWPCSQRFLNYFLSKALFELNFWALNTQVLVKLSRALDSSASIISTRQDKRTPLCVWEGCGFVAKWTGIGHRTTTKEEILSTEEVPRTSMSFSQDTLLSPSVVNGTVKSSSRLDSMVNARSRSFPLYKTLVQVQFLPRGNWETLYFAHSGQAKPSSIIVWRT